MHRNKSVSNHQFAMIPRADIPRSTMRTQTTHKTTIDSGYLIPWYVDEVLPGDSFKMRATIFARVATPLFPIMDNMWLDIFYFFVPNRLVWDNWKRFQGEQPNPGDSISFTIPQQVCPAGGYAINSLQDYFGLPTVGQMIPAGTFSHSALPLRAYNLIYNEWFRDENLQNSVTVDKGNGPDNVANYVKLRRGKRHDYFTSALPWPQKGNTAVTIPLGTSAPVISDGNAIGLRGITSGTSTQMGWTGGLATLNRTGGNAPSTEPVRFDNAATGLIADLSTATAATINQLRQAFTIQQLLERDARGGTRYTEIILSHFGVRSPDARLQRPEYLGGGSTRIQINPIVQTGPTGTTGSDTPLGQLGAMGTALSQGNGYTQSFTEHGYVIGLASIRADLTYQQGVRKLWNRLTRYDFYMPTFANLGEQAVYNQEIWVRGAGQDSGVFGYQERWAEYRYFPSMITGLFRSTAAGTLDPWHLAQNFTTLPTLNSTFIQENPPVNRMVAVPSEGTNQQFLVDIFMDMTRARPMPVYSVPGLTKL